MAAEKAEEGTSPDPSLVETPEVVAEAVVETPATDAKSADSSAADDKDAKAEPVKSLLDVVTDAVKPVEAKAGESSDPEKPDSTEAKAEVAEPEKKGAEADADAEVPFHNHPRWKQLQADLAGFKPDAERYRNISSFMAEHELSAEEVAEGYMVMAQLKSGDPASLRKALTYFETHADELRTALGETLPADLQAKVDDKQIDLEDAQEIAKNRASLKLRDASEQRRDERTETEKSAETARKLVAEQSAAVSKWEVDTRAKDPDYARKQDLVETFLKVEWQMVQPKSVPEALATVERAYAKANGTVASFVPAKKPVDTTIPSSSSAIVKAAPKSMLEAVTSAVSG